jgi:putative SOS response-associated peptidase YedK
MCGRISQKLPIEDLESLGIECKEEFIVSYNISPSLSAMVIYKDGNRIELISMKWGLIPEWVKVENYRQNLFNARSEEASQKPSFKKAIEKSQFCLLPVDSFYEWKLIGKQKVPYRCIHQTDPILFLAGLFQKHSFHKKDFFSFTILTTKANDSIATLHNRMPIIIEKNQIYQYLEGSLAIESLSTETKLTFYEVSQNINGTIKNDSSLHIPVNNYPTLF